MLKRRQTNLVEREEEKGMLLREWWHKVVCKILAAWESLGSSHDL